MEQIRAGSSALSGTEVFEQTCYEFTRILYEYSEEEKRARQNEIEMYRNRIAELEARCREYEANIFQGNENGGQLVRKHRKQDIMKKKHTAGKKRIKAICFRIGQFVFALGRRLTGKWGLKDKLKKSVLYKKLYLKGTIDKLRG